MEIRADRPNVFICHMGLERSPAAAEGLKDHEYLAGHIPGGTAKIKTMTPEEIKELIPEDAKVRIIYDHGSNDIEYHDLEEAEEILRRADIHWSRVSTVDLMCALYTLGIRLEDYL